MCSVKRMAVQAHGPFYPKIDRTLFLDKMGHVCSPKKLRTNCAKHVRGGRIERGKTIHSNHSLHHIIANAAYESTVRPTHHSQPCTHFVHSNQRIQNRLTSHFSAKSTGSTTITTIYIHNKKGKA